MQKQTILIITIVLVVLGLAVYFFTNDKEPTVKPQPPTTETSTNEVTQDTSANMINYNLSSDSTVSYVVKKTYLGKEPIVVQGDTSAITSDIWYNKDTKEFYLSLDIDLTKLKTDSAFRDSDIQKRFSDPSAQIVYGPVVLLDSEYNAEVSKTIEVPVTINGVTKPLSLELSGMIGDTGFNIKGKTAFLMSDFGVEAPNVFDVYVVADEMQVVFDLTLE